VKNIFLSVIILFLLLTVGCVSTEEGSTGPQEGQWDEISYVEATSFSFDEYILENNMWGKGSIEEYSQCIFMKDKGGGIEFGWEWEWPYEHREVKAYPEIIYGWKPFRWESTTEKLPLRLDSIKNLTVTYAAEIEATGTYNFAFDIWITKAAQPSEENITREIMIWVDSTYWSPHGTVVDTVVFDGEEYNFHKASISTWSYLAFQIISKDNMLKGDLDIKKFLDYLIENSHMSSGEYLASIELGNEIMEGKGRTIISKFIVNAE
jgi:hypothetical protein